MPSAFQATGFGFTFDDAIGFTSITGAADLTLSFTSSAPVLNYSGTVFNAGSIVQEVNLGGSAVRVSSINGVVLDDTFDTAFGRVTWNGQTTDLMIITDGADAGYFFRLGGAALPTITTVAEGNAFLQAIGENNPFPPAPFGPNTNIPLTAFDGFQPLDLSEMTTYSTQGFSLFDVGPDGPNALQLSQLSVTFNTPGAALFFETIEIDADVEGPGGTGFAVVRVGFTEAPIAFTLDGQPIEIADGAMEVMVARFTSPAGAHDVLIFDTFGDNGPGRFHVLPLGGEPLPAATDPAAVAAFFNALISIDPIPAGQPTSEGAQIALSGLPAVVVGTETYTPPAPSDASGDPAVLFLSGYILTETGDTITDLRPAELSLAFPADNGLLNYSIIGFDNDLPLIDFAGMDPYATLINGVTLGRVDASVARLTFDANTYYDVMFFIPPNSDVYAMFQIGGSGAVINLDSLAAATAFINNLDTLGQVSAIPAGQTFAPDTSFTLLDSSFTRLESDPLIIEGGNFSRGAGGATYGRGAGTFGSVTVVNGAELQIGPNGVDGPFISVGRDFGGGQMVVAGPDSVISVTAGGGNTGIGAEGVGISIGRDGGSGVLRVLDDARFLINDPVGTASGVDRSGAEFMTVGRGSAAFGVLDVIGAEFVMSGTGAELRVGSSNGSGEVWLEDAATFLVQSTSAGDNARLRIGHDMGQGRLIIDESQALVQAATGGESLLTIGSGGGQGLVRVFGMDSSLTVSGGVGNGVIEIATNGLGSVGVLWVGIGATVTVGQITMGGAEVDLAALVLAGGSVTASAGVSVGEHAGIGGTGTLTGAVSVSDGFISVGDVYDTQTNVFNTGLGQLNIAGNVTSNGGEAQFQFGDFGSDLLNVTGALQLTDSTIEVTYLGAYTPAQGRLEQILARATAGISLDDIVLQHNLGNDPDIASGLELRAGGTELWFYHGEATVTLSGTVTMREVNSGAVNPGGTSVRFTASDGSILTTTTDSAGAFSFDVPVGAAGSLEFLRDYSTAAPALDKTLTTSDVLRMFRLVSGRISPENYTPEDLIAADFNGNGTANTADVLDLFRFVSGRAAQHSPEYIFINDDADLDSMTFSTIPQDAPITITPLLADASLSITAILSGDLNGHV